MGRELFIQGKKMMDMGRYEEAKELFLKLLAEDPGNAEAHNKLGVIAAGEKNFNEARKYFLKAMELKPGFSSAASNLGNLFFEAGDFEAAEEYYKKAINMDPDNPVPYNNLAVIYKNQGKIDRFVDFYKKSVSLSTRRGMEDGPAGSGSRAGNGSRIIWWIVGIILTVIVFSLFWAG
ncbi:tetratricopeptide repeat protein [Thermoanaerobacterium sp. DL9XJH110]|jgi:tetratricopeptide (TPR) repeat protein|uniref:tetratricopeptide repeat protein n=1 Tax=Thermoanaerobacterium sp. DL9XJH110 TaxID=3386643 RepID=UPI003BB54D8D